MNVKGDPVIDLAKRRVESYSPEGLAPCPARTMGVLGFDKPTEIPCGKAKGHAGAHCYTITWHEEGY